MESLMMATRRDLGGVVLVEVAATQPRTSE